MPLQTSLQVACRLNQFIKYMPISAPDLRVRSLALPLLSSLGSSLGSGHCYHLVLSVTLLLHCLAFCTDRGGENDKACLFSRPRWSNESRTHVSVHRVFFFFFFGLFRAHPQHMEASRLGVKSELQLPAPQPQPHQI